MDLGRQQSELRLKLYQLYLQKREAVPFPGSFVPYKWSELTGSLSGTWLPYSQMLDEFSRELANTINDLTHHIHRLRAWNLVLASLSNDEKMEATHEFIEMLGVAAVGLPYVIKSRFAYAAAHLCHQANRAKYLANWKDDFPAEHNLYLNDADRFGRRWKKYRAFKVRVEAIGGTAFKRATGDFRNAYNHRFPQRLVLGITGFVTRRVDDATGNVHYRIGGVAPLQIDAIGDLLSIEQDLSHAAFGAFQALVHEHEAAIDAFERAHSSKSSD